MREWRDEARGLKRPAVGELSDLDLVCREQTSEPDPSEAAAENELDKLIAEQGKDGRTFKIIQKL